MTDYILCSNCNKKCPYTGGYKKRYFTIGTKVSTRYKQILHNDVEPWGEKMRGDMVLRHYYGTHTSKNKQ